MALELPSGYYLKNFGMLVDTVVDRYEDMLREPEMRFVGGFRGLPEGSARLYVRLIMRKGPLFRSDKLSYDDVPDIGAAAQELVRAGFLRTGGDYDTEEALRLCTVGELRDLFSPPPHLRKVETVDSIVSGIDDTGIRSSIDGLFDVFEPLHLDIVATFRLLFFGNLRQDLSEFVVIELGHVQYEVYPLDRANRPFPERADLDAALLVHSWRDRLAESLQSDEEDGQESRLLIADEISATELPTSAAGRRDRVGNAVARELERDGATLEALNLYECIGLPPSRERRVRILEKQRRHDEAAAVLEEIESNPLSESELVFAESFGYRMNQRHGPPYGGGRQQRIDPPRKSVQLSRTVASVEVAALEYYRAEGYEGAWCENALFRGLFGLGFWDIVFASVPGAFHNRFQRGPSDLLGPGFRENRQALIEARLDEIASASWKDQVRATYEGKRGVANPFVDWKHLSPDIVDAALDRIPASHLHAIFDRLSRDVRENGSGFPDLFLYRGSADYLLVEVKGPGDQLQKNQLRWMRVFAEVGIPHVVLWVEWEGEAP